MAFPTSATLLLRPRGALAEVPNANLAGEHTDAVSERPDSPREWRIATRRRIAFGVPCAVFILLIGADALGTETAAGHSAGAVHVARAAVVLLNVCIFGLLFVRYWQCRVVLRDGFLDLHGMWRTQTIGANEVAAVHPSPRGLVFDLTDGRSVRSPIAGGFGARAEGRATADSILRQIRKPAI